MREYRAASDLATIAEEITARLQDEQLQPDCLVHRDLLHFRMGNLTEAAKAITQTLAV